MDNERAFVGGGRGVVRRVEVGADLGEFDAALERRDARRLRVLVRLLPLPREPASRRSADIYIYIYIND